jgi:hypothetical protein
VKRIKVPTELPPIVKQLQESYPNKIYIHRTEDYGPSTKLLGALENEKDPDTVIMVIDDDTRYHPDTALSLLEMIERIQKPVCFGCEKWSWFWMNTYSQKTEGVCNGFMNAYSAVAVK